MSSDDEFDDLQLDLSFEELEALDIRAALALSAHESQPTPLPNSKVSAPDTTCIQSSDGSSASTAPLPASLESRRRQTERLHAANSGPPGPSRLPKLPATILESQGSSQPAISWHYMS